MLTWLWNLAQGDFAQNPTAWIDLAITVLGIVLSPVAWFVSKWLESESSKQEAAKAQKKFDTQLEVLKGQLEAAKDSANALREQVEAQKSTAEALRAQVSLLERQAELSEAVAAVPVWGFEQSRPRSIVYEVTNRNAFDAFDVRVEYNDDGSYELGNMTKGSSTSFNFIESGIWGGVQTDITISWLPSPDAAKREHLRMAMPARL